MISEEFLNFLNGTFNKCAELVEEKSKFYGLNEDRLSQFKSMAVILKTSPEAAAYAMVTKHFTALSDMLAHQENFTSEQFDSYLLDIIVYMTLIRALLSEKEKS